MRIFYFLCCLLLGFGCSQKAMPSSETEQLETLYVVEVDERTYRIDNRVKETDPSIDSLIAPYRAQLQETMNEVIGNVTQEMNKRKPFSLLTNWVGDLVYDIAAKHSEEPIDFAIQNYGGIRVNSIGKGPLTVGKIFELMPFDNKIVVVTIDGSIVQKLADDIIDYGGGAISQHLYIEGQSKIADKVLINGKPLDLSRQYRVAMPDYVANGGGGINYAQEGNLNDLGLLIRDGMIEELRNSNADIPGEYEKRIIIKDDE